MMKEAGMAIHREIKYVVKTALTQSNKCVATTTSEWVKVRILAAKTYLIEKKFNKAIHILTDLCYVIPPDMLNINSSGNANLMLYDYDENAQKIELGGIRFCN